MWPRPAALELYNAIGAVFTEIHFEFTTRDEAEACAKKILVAFRAACSKAGEDDFFQVFAARLAVVLALMRTAGNRPVWKQAGIKLYLYRAYNGGWYVSTADAKDVRKAVGTAYSEVPELDSLPTDARKWNADVARKFEVQTWQVCFWRPSQGVRAVLHVVCRDANYTVTPAAQITNTPKTKQARGTSRFPGRWAGWWAGLWRGLRWSKLPLLIEQGHDDGIEFFIRGGRPFPASPVAP